MKIILISPPFKLNEIYGLLFKSAPIFPPLELAYLASYLRNDGHNVCIVDSPALELELNDIEKIIKEYKPDMVGTPSNSPIFSCIYSLYSRALDVLHRAKTIDSHIKTFMWGYHPTILTGEVLKEVCVDFTVMGDPEMTVAQLCSAINCKEDLSSVNGIGFKNGASNHVINPCREILIDLDVLPMPAFDLLPMEKYRFASAGPAPQKGIMIRTNRGCEYGCYFCPVPGYCKGKVSTHSPEYILKIMDHLFNKYGCLRFQIHDDNFGKNHEWIKKFCTALIAKNSPYQWECYERFNLLDESTLRMMKDAGCNMISLGVEAGSDIILKKFKGISKAVIADGMLLLRRIGIKSRLFFMIGPPSQTEKDINDLIKYAIKLDPDVFIATVSIPMPGSRFYDDMKKLGCVPDFQNKLVPVYEAPHDLPNFTKEYLDRSIRKAYRSFYLRPRYILRCILRINSLKDLFHYLQGTKFVFKK